MPDSTTSKDRHMRLIFMGMGGPLSSSPLHFLLQAGFQFDAVVVAAAHRETHWRALPAPRHHGQSPSPTGTGATGSIVQLAWQHDIALYEVGNLRAGEVHDALQRLAPDAVLVSCFSHRVPGNLLRLPRHGFLNLHPSLLPAYRGPYPLFWQLRDGASEIGLTVHRMDEGLDTGPIAAQRSVPLQEGMSGSELERLAGAEGGRLFVQVLNKLVANELTFRAQEAGGSQQGQPQDDDFALDRSWSARHAFNFMRGTVQWGQPYPLVVGNRRWLLRRAVSFAPDAFQKTPVVETRNSLNIQFNPGILEAS